MSYSPNLPKGQSTMANSAPVVIASDQTSIPVASTLSAETTKVIGTVNQGTSPWVVSGTVTANAGTNLNTSALALESGGNLSAIKADTDKIPSLGQALAAGSVPVVLTAAQIITLTPPAAITNYAVETGGNLASVKTDVDNLALSQASTTSGQKGNLTLAAVTTSAPAYTTAQSNPLSLDTSGNLRTSVNNTVTITGSISNTSFAVTNAGTFAVQNTATTPAGTNVIGALTANQSVNVAQINGVTPLMGNGVTGTGSQRVTIASDNTAFSVNAIQSGSWSVTANAGTNLNTSALALETGGNLASTKTNTDNLNLAQASTTSGQKGNLILGAVTTSAPTYTTAQSNPLSLDTAGNLRTSTTLAASSNVIGHVITDSGSVTAATLSAETTKVIGTVNISASQTIAVTQATGTNLHTVVDSGTITTLTGTTTLTPGTAAANLGKAEDAAAADGDTGVFSLNRRNDNAATAQTNTNGDYSAAAVDVNGSMFNRPAPANTSALTTVVSSATTVTLLAANAARRLMTCYNSSTSDAYVKFGTTASSTSFSLYLPSLGSFSLNGEDYAGRVDIIWISANGNAYVTETSI